MIPAEFDYFAPKSVEEAMKLLATYGDEAKLLAGGHSLIPTMKLRLTSFKYLIDIGRIPALTDIKEEGGALVVGALATHSAIERSKLVQAKCPLLAEVASNIGDMQIRNRGTIGGSLAHADPAADWPAGILALDAEMTITGSNGTRTVKAADFFTGMLETALQPGEILTAIRVPVTTDKTSYLKVPQSASGFAIVGVAVRLGIDASKRCSAAAVAVTGVADHAYRARSAEQQLAGNVLDDTVIGRAAALAAEGIDALSDIHASSDYRTHLAGVYVTRALKAALAR